MTARFAPGDQVIANTGARGTPPWTAVTGAVAGMSNASGSLSLCVETLHGTLHWCDAKTVIVHLARKEADMSATVPAVLAAGGPKHRIVVGRADGGHFTAIADGKLFPAGHGCCAQDALDALLRHSPGLLMEGCTVEVRP